MLRDNWNFLGRRAVWRVGGGGVTRSVLRLTVHTVSRMLESVDWGGRVGATVGPHAKVGPSDRRLPGTRVVHGGVVYRSPVLTWQRLYLLLQLLRVQPVRVHSRGPGVAGDGWAAVAQPHPRVVRDPGVAVVLHMGLRWHVLHLLKQAIVRL